MAEADKRSVDQLPQLSDTEFARAAEAAAVVPVEFEGIGVAYLSPRDLAAVLHHAKQLRDAEAPPADATDEV